MTIVGVIANIGTSITLTKNGQVGTKLEFVLLSKFFIPTSKQKKQGLNELDSILNQGITT